MEKIKPLYRERLRMCLWKRFIRPEPPILSGPELDIERVLLHNVFSYRMCWHLWKPLIGPEPPILNGPTMPPPPPPLPPPPLPSAINPEMKERGCKKKCYLSLWLLFSINPEMKERGCKSFFFSRGVKTFSNTLATHWQHISNTLRGPDGCWGIATHWQHTDNTLATHWQHTDNTLATHWQHTDNTLATHWQHISNTLREPDGCLAIAFSHASKP
jgi:hypothetical protein